ncbi:MAG: hypothetical protein FWE19_08115 [Oscillospiraceae bacterium]|nr:hypothetical protein [Oscillospiraceae bacterium]
MKKQLSLNRLLGSNRFLVVLALLIAVVGWMIVAMSEDQMTERVISGVKVDLDRHIGTFSAMGLSLIGTQEHTVDVVVFGARSVVGSLEAEDFVISVNTAQVTVPNDYQLAVEAIGRTPGNDLMTRTYPEVVEVRLDHINSQMFEVNWEIAGLASAPGFMADLPRLSPSSNVWITGPQAELDRVDRVVVAVELEEALNSPWAQEVPIILRDVAGNEIAPQETQLALEHENLTMQIPVLRVRTLPLVLDFQNLPGGLSELLLRSFMQKSAETVTIAGPISTMASHHDWWLGTINLRSLTPENNIFFFDIDMPSEQFINVDNLQAVIVEFDTENWDSVSFDIPAEDFIITGDPGGNEITVQTVALNGVTFVGDAEEIAELTLSDIVVEINLSDRELIIGPQPHPVRINIPGSELVWPVEQAGNLIVHIMVTPREE